MCKEVNTDHLCDLFMNAQAKILAGIHSCFSMDFDQKMYFRFEEFPLIKRKWIIKDKHDYFKTVIGLQSFKGERDSLLIGFLASYSLTSSERPSVRENPKTRP